MFIQAHRIFSFLHPALLRRITLIGAVLAGLALGAMAQQPVRVYGHGRLTCSAGTPDGKLVLTGGALNATLWDGQTGAILQILKGHTNVIVTAAFAADGKTVATGSWDKTARVWDTATGQLVRSFVTTSTVYRVLLSADGKRLVTASDQKRVWDVPTGRLEQTFLSSPDSNVNLSDLSADGTRVLYGMVSTTVGIWDIATSRTVKLFDTGLADNLSQYPMALFSPDDRSILVGNNYGLPPAIAARIFDVNDSRTSITLTVNDYIYETQVDWSADGSRVLTANRKTAWIWDARAGQLLNSLTTPSDGYLARVALTDNGAALRIQNMGNHVLLADSLTGGVIRRFGGYAGGVTSLAFAPDGETFIAGGDDMNAQVWGVDAGAVQRILTGHDSAVTAVDFTRGGGKLLTASLDRTVRVYDAGGGALLNTLRGHTNTINCATFTPDGTRVLTGGEDRTLRLWDLATSQTVFTRSDETTAVASLACSPDGKTALAGGWDGAVRLYDLQTGTLTATLTGISHAVASLAISPDGTQALVGGCDAAAYTARLIDLRAGTRGQTLMTLAGHRDDLIAVVFSPTGRRVLTASYDGMVKLWDLGLRREVLSLSGFTGQIRAMAFSPDGTRALTAGDDGVVRLWDVSKNGVGVWARYE